MLEFILGIIIGILLTAYTYWIVSFIKWACTELSTSVVFNSDTNSVTCKKCGLCIYSGVSNVMEMKKCPWCKRKIKGVCIERNVQEDDL